MSRRWYHGSYYFVKEKQVAADVRVEDAKS